METIKFYKQKYNIKSTYRLLKFFIKQTSYEPGKINEVQKEYVDAFDALLAIDFISAFYSAYLNKKLDTKSYCNKKYHVHKTANIADQSAILLYDEPAFVLRNTKIDTLILNSCLRCIAAYLVLHNHVARTYENMLSSCKNLLTFNVIYDFLKTNKANIFKKINWSTISERLAIHSIDIITHYNLPIHNYSKHDRYCIEYVLLVAEKFSYPLQFHHCLETITYEQLMRLDASGLFDLSDKSIVANIYLNPNKKVQKYFIQKNEDEVKRFLSAAINVNYYVNDTNYKLLKPYIIDILRNTVFRHLNFENTLDNLRCNRHYDNVKDEQPAVLFGIAATGTTFRNRDVSVYIVELDETHYNKYLHPLKYYSNETQMKILSEGRNIYSIISTNYVSKEIIMTLTKKADNILRTADLYNPTVYLILNIYRYIKYSEQFIVSDAMLNSLKSSVILLEVIMQYHLVAPNNDFLTEICTKGYKMLYKYIEPIRLNIHIKSCDKKPCNIKIFMTQKSRKNAYNTSFTDDMSSDMPKIINAMTPIP